MVSCSMAAHNTEAQGVQESLSKVRASQGPGAPGAAAGAGSVRRPGDLGPFPCLWAGLPLAASKHAVARRSLAHKRAHTQMCTSW